MDLPLLQKIVHNLYEKAYGGICFSFFAASVSLSKSMSNKNIKDYSNRNHKIIKDELLWEWPSEFELYLELIRQSTNDKITPISLLNPILRRWRIQLFRIMDSFINKLFSEEALVLAPLATSRRQTSTPPCRWNIE